MAAFAKSWRSTSPMRCEPLLKASGPNWYTSCRGTNSKGGKHAKSVFGHLRHIYISIRQLPGKPRQCDDAGRFSGHAHRDRRHRGYLSGPLPSWAGAPPILAL
jgi:hypothetical protein